VYLKSMNIRSATFCCSRQRLSMVMGRDEWACVTKLHDPMRCLCVVGLIGCQHQLKRSSSSKRACSSG
jgi:hypothetical protein